MLREFKFYITFLSSYVISSLIIIFTTNFELPIHMYLFVLFPLLSSLGALLYKKIEPNLIRIGTYTIFIISIFMFYTDISIKQLVSIDLYSIAAAIYFLLSIIYALSILFAMPDNNIHNNTRNIHISDIWFKTQKSTLLVMSGLFIPQYLIIFYSSGMIRYLLSTLFILAPIIISSIYTNILISPIIKQEEARIHNELIEQIRKEEGCNFIINHINN